VNTFPWTIDPELTTQIAGWSVIHRPNWGSTGIDACEDNRLQSLIFKLTKKPVGLLGWFK